MRLSNKVAIITGSGSGIGRESAVLFSKEGAKVSVVDIDGEGGEHTVDLIAQQGTPANFIHADVSKASDVERVINTTVKNYGKLDILFNNAGVPMPFTPVEDVEEERYDRIMDVNVKGVFLGCKYAVPLMKKQGGGVILNISSISGIRPRVGNNAYAASKGAVITLTKALAIELAPYQIRVNCINPVAIDTPMFPKFMSDNDITDDELEKGKKGAIDTIPLGRLAQPEDIAYAALYLASDESSLVTGVSFNVDGGRGI
jgi:3-oxoacyl-[acyl-carrier protein] reductase